MNKYKYVLSGDINVDINLNSEHTLDFRDIIKSFI